MGGGFKVMRSRVMSLHEAAAEGKKNSIKYTVFVHYKSNWRLPDDLLLTSSYFYSTPQCCALYSCYIIPLCPPHAGIVSKRINHERRIIPSAVTVSAMYLVFGDTRLINIA